MNISRIGLPAFKTMTRRHKPVDRTGRKKDERIGRTVTLTITDMSTNGEGIGHVEGAALFVAGAIPGDTVEARITWTRKNMGYADCLRILEPSADRTVPACPMAAVCGGCALQDMAYEAQLSLKRSSVENSLRRIGSLELTVPPVIGMEEPVRYRNKTQYPVGRSADGRLVCGFYRRGSHEIIPLEDCLIGSERNAAITARILKFMEAEGIEPYEEKTGLGLVRHILIRESHANGSVLVCLVINGQSLPQGQRLVDSLRELPEITGICLNVNTARNNVILGQEVIPLWGEPCIYDKIGERTFRISPLSFFQINPIQTEKLYAEVARMADLSGHETVLDLFCGAGTIGLYLADKVRELYGVEIVPEAIEDARVNAALNHIENARFSAGASEDIFRDLPSADLVILDPPRKGCEASLIKELADRGQERIIYVSCNPATLARDLKLFAELGYEVKDLRCVDMFPQTMHVETVVLLSKAN